MRKKLLAKIAVTDFLAGVWGQLFSRDIEMNSENMLLADVLSQEVLCSHISDPQGQKNVSLYLRGS